jgi:dihydrofolate reductase
MILSLIAAASTNNVIGKNNKLLWHLPNDMKFFKNMTWGMPVIMGRNTFLSMEGGPLPGRFNFVISKHPDVDTLSDQIKWASSVQQAIDMAKETDCKETFVIGGGQIYSETISLADKIYLTRVHAEFDGDAFFPVIDPSKWKMDSSIDFAPDQKHAYAYSFQLWVKIDNKGSV